MDFLEYKNILANNDIYLFDYDYRNSYHNMFILNDELYLFNQTGGGQNKEFFISPFILIKKSNKKVINKFIDNLTQNNFNGAKYLCKNEFI